MKNDLNEALFLGFIVAGALVAASSWLFRRWWRDGYDRHPEENGLVSIETGEPLIPIRTTALTLTLISFVGLLIREPGWWAPDSRFIQHWNPERALALATTGWTPVSNMGAVPNVQGLLLYGYSALFQLFGAAPWLIERLFESTLLSIGAVGAAMVTREFMPRSRYAHLLAGLCWLASAYTTAYLVPSYLFLNGALCPWLVVALIRGATQSRWRWAAVVALAVAISGFGNLPAFVHSSLPLIPTAVYLLTTGATSIRRLAGWSVKVAVVLVPLIAYDVHRISLNANAYAQNLAVSESAAAVSRSSSWSESLRGLGFWKTYLNLSGNGLLHSWEEPFFTNWLLVVATFLSVVAALAFIVFSRRRDRFLFGGILVLATTVMVGAYPDRAPSPYGRFLFWIYDAVPVTFALRNSYKAGAGLVLAVAALCGMAGADLRERLTGRRWLLGGSTVLIGLVLLATSSPLWTAGQFQAGPYRISDVPQYWKDAAAWLDRQPGQSRVFIAPGYNETYRWGSPSGSASQGDLFLSLFHRPYVVDTLISQVSPDAANLITSLDANVSLGHYPVGSIRAIAHRMGIGYVLIRNDLNWQFSSSIRPAQLESLRRDPDLVLEATFGARGQNVVDDHDQSFDAGRERRLPPVEIYRVRGTNEPSRAVAGPSLLLSGDGDAWPSLATDGTLDAQGPVRYTARLDNGELDDELKNGASVFITDTNRRRGIHTGPVRLTTVTEETTGSVEDLFGRPGSQSVVVYADAKSIAYIGSALLAPPGPQNRPAAAFDGDPATTFVAGAYNPLGAHDGLRVELKRTMPISSITMDTTSGGDRKVVAAEIAFPDGTRVPLDLATGKASASFPTQQTDRFDIVVTRLSVRNRIGARDAPWSIRDIEIPGLDLTETIQVPDDVIRLADENPQSASLLATAPLSFRFERLATQSGLVESTLRRRFRVPSARTFTGSGTLTMTSSVTSSQLRSVLGTPSAAQSTSTFGDRIYSSPLYAVDENQDTAWQVPAGFPAELDVSVARHVISSIDVTVDSSALVAPLKQLAVTVGTSTVLARIPTPELCPASGPCLQTITVPLPPTEADGVQLTVVESGNGQPDSRPVRVVEVHVDGQSNSGLPTDLQTTCQTDLATIDGSPVGIVLRGSTFTLLSGGPIQVSLCSPLQLTADWHTLLSVTGLPLSRFVLVAEGSPPTPAHDIAVDADPAGTSFNLHLDAPAGARLVLGQAMSTGWHATTNGRDLGTPIELDAQTGWTIRDGGTSAVRASFAATPMSGVLLVVFCLGLLVSIAVIVIDPRSKPPSRAGAAQVHVRRDRRRRRGRLAFLARIADPALVLFAFAIGGWSIAFLAFMALLFLHRGWIGERQLSWTCLAFLAAAVVFSVPPIGPALEPVASGWPLDRRTANDFARIAIVLFTVLLGSSVKQRLGVLAAQRAVSTVKR